MKGYNIILTGVQGVGKTTFGKKLAEKIGYQFIDTDRAIEMLYEQRESEFRVCREIFIMKGEEYFRALEAQVIASLVGIQKTVIALGGGAILEETTRALLPKLGRIVCLYLEFSEVKKRWKQAPGLFQDERIFQELFDKRMDRSREIPCTWLRADSERTLPILEEMALGK